MFDLIKYKPLRQLLAVTSPNLGAARKLGSTLGAPEAGELPQAAEGYRFFGGLNEN